MMEFYAVKQNFYAMLKKHPNVCQDITVLSNEQCDAILHKIDAEMLYTSAISYFDQMVQWNHEFMRLKMSCKIVVMRYNFIHILYHWIMQIIPF